MARHVPVLLSEVVDSLQLTASSRVIDCTLGDAGHSEAMLQRLGATGKLLGIDADPESLLRAKQNLYRFADKVTFVRDNFVHLENVAAEHGFNPADAILMDLGWSSPQFAERGRGFSFEGNESLDMRYAGSADHDQPTAADVLRSYSEGELTKIFKQYGEEDFSTSIAAAIVAARHEAPIERTKQLVDIVLDVYRTKLKSTKEVPWVGGIHPATKVFQALRIEVNHELAVLKQALAQAVNVLAPGGRLAVITFHSLEDRIVKHFFQTEDNKRVHIITKKPIVASETELALNPRARSAKLRVAERMP